MSAPAASFPAPPPTEHLAGLVERVIFHNEENGFCVLRLEARGQRDLTTVAGHAATITAGEFVRATGSWTTDRTHGLQFRASFLGATPPTTAEGTERLLGSGMIRGIGPPGRHHTLLRRRARAGRRPRFQATRCAPARKGACCTMPQHPGTA